MRKFKTPKGNRTNYIYRTAEGKEIVITPEMLGNENVEIITLLHSWDDDEVDANRREDYHVPVHYQNYCEGEEGDSEGSNPYLSDKESNPMMLLLSSLDEDERLERAERLVAAVQTLTDLQRQTIHKKYYRNMSNVDIAAEEGVSEAAIRHRLSKIHENLRKKITE